LRKPLLYRAAAVLAGALLAVSGASAAFAGGNGWSNGDHGGHSGDHKPCTPVNEAKYKSTLDGLKGDATVELLNGPVCEAAPISLVSYTAPSKTFALPQYVMQFDTQSFQPVAASADKYTKNLTKSVLTFHVEIPTCYYQVDLVTGSKIENPLTSNNLYGDRKLKWYNGGEGVCAAKPAVEDVSDCTGGVDLKLINRESNLAADFKVTGDAGFSKTVTVAHNKVGDLPVPAESAKNIVVTVDGKEIFRGGWKKPENCQPPGGSKPTASLTSTCAGLVFHISNPADGVPVTVTLTPNKGQAQTVTVKPGETPADVTFPGQEGLTVTVSGDLDAQNGVVTWTKPSDCASPSHSASPSASTSASASPSASASTSTSPAAAPSTTPVSSDSNLPKTGAAAGTVAGGAVLLLLIGGVLFYLARRRKVNFTA
jgi:LPXTG-motif cell wall-anchored protein